MSLQFAYQEQFTHKIELRFVLGQFLMEFGHKLDHTSYTQSTGRLQSATSASVTRASCSHICCSSCWCCSALQSSDFGTSLHRAAPISALPSTVLVWITAVRTAVAGRFDAQTPLHLDRVAGKCLVSAPFSPQPRASMSQLAVPLTSHPVRRGFSQLTE